MLTTRISSFEQTPLKGNSRALLPHFGIGYPLASMQAQDQEVTQKESQCVVQNIISVALSEVLFRRWGSSPIRLLSLCVSSGRPSGS
jgi:hypothetical protein